MAKNTRLKPVGAAVVFALLVAACGGAAAPAKSPEAAPSSDMEKMPAEPASPANGATPTAAPESAPSAAGTSSDSSNSSREAELRGARRDVQLATRDLDSSMGDCANVCRALSSLARATAHLCALASGDSDRTACDDAKNRVNHARAQIKASCGTCPNGESLDTR